MDNISETYDALRQENERLRKECEEARSTSAIYTHIAHALSRDYTDLFYVNMKTDEFIEYHTDEDLGLLVETRRAHDFFESCAREARLFVHPDDQEAFVRAMNRDFLERALDHFQVYEMTYRRLKDKRMFYVEMKVTRMRDDDYFIVIAVSDIDELVKKRRLEERIREERLVYARLHAITGNFIVVYVVDPKTGAYHEFSSTEAYTQSVADAEIEDDFFENIRDASKRFVHPADLRRYLTFVTKENMLAEIERSGIFTFGYRFLMMGDYIHVQLKAAVVEEREGRRLIVGLNDIDVQVRQEQEYERRLAVAESQVNIDALTHVKNRHAYLDTEARINAKISGHSMGPFALVVMDLNDLKKVNDTAGHQAGDKYIQEACKIICNVFKHSPVFRIGGDEFTAICEGIDYTSIEERLGTMRDLNEIALQTAGIVIACGMARLEDDTCLETMFERADRAMYADKLRLKALEII